MCELRGICSLEGEGKDEAHLGFQSCAGSQQPTILAWGCAPQSYGHLGPLDKHCASMIALHVHGTLSLPLPKCTCQQGAPEAPLCKVGKLRHGAVCDLLAVVRLEVDPRSPDAMVGRAQASWCSSLVPSSEAGSSALGISVLCP